MNTSKYFYVVAGAAGAMAIIEPIMDFPWYMDTMGWLALFITAILSADEIGALHEELGKKENEPKMKNAPTE